MRKGLSPSLSFSCQKMITCSKKKFLIAPIFLLLMLLYAGYVSAQANKIDPQVAQQIQSLMDEKASRTPAQKKMSSQLIYAYKMRGGQRITAEVASLEIDVTKDAQGRVKVELDATVSTQLLNQLTALGCEILLTSPKYGSILANIPVDKLEQVAALDAVKHLVNWTAPMNNSGRPDKTTITINGTNDAGSNGKFFPGFRDRADKIRKHLDGALKQKEFNGRFAFEGAVTSEADVTHKAALAREVFGTDGTGVKIGVLSNGVAGYAAAIASGDLPPFTILPGQEGSASEGWAMMELIHDLAPGAQLYFATANPTQAQFAQNILDLRAAGCDIIVDDVSYFAEGVFQDDNVAQAVNTVTASGALYFSSAGNSGNENDNTSGVWEGDFVDGGASAAPIPLTGNLHNFSGGTLFNVLTLAGRVTLKWSDPLGQSGNDYDLFVTNAAGTALAASSTTVQDGNDNPYEDVGNRSAGQRIYILKKTGAAVRALHLNTNRGLLTFHTPGVVFGHNAAASAYTVAATPTSVSFGGTGSTTGPYPGVFNASNKVEGFSSDGPRRIFYNPDGSPITPGNVLYSTNGGIILQKPDITAGDGAVTTTPGFVPFFGTSAAAPHAAAIAALIKSKLPALTPAQIRAALISSAIDIETPGVDRDAGAGIIMAYEALLAAGAPAISNISLGTVTAVEVAGNGNGFVEPGDQASMTVQLTAQSPVDATNVNAVLTTSTPGVVITQNSADYGNIAGNGNAVNTATPYLFTINPQVPCGTVINFTLTVTYGGGGASPKILNFTVKTGSAPGTITATLGSAPPAGVGYVATFGTQTNRLNRNGNIPSCGTQKATPNLQEAAPGTSKSYHAYTFTNSSTISQCVTVSISSSAVTTIYETVYGNGGYNPASIQANYLADQGTTTNAAPFSFTAAAGQQFTVVVHEVNTGGGVGVTYNLNVGFQSCVAPPVIINASSPVVITAENALPANNTPDPGETVTLNLPLINIGSANTNNLVATLQPTGGVTNPSSPQSYGVVAGGGSPVARPYTFTAAGNCGDNITLTLALQDGTTNLGTVTYTLRLGTSIVNAPVTFANTTPIIIPGTGTGAVGGAPSNPYPSNIAVSGLSGTISKITVGLKQFNHTFPDDVSVLLVSPTGQKMIIMSSAGDGTDAVNVNLILDDAAAGTLPATGLIASGTYRPTNIDATYDVFVAPAPAGPYLNPAPLGTATFATAFNGQNPNGNWSLYAIDNFSGDAGNFNGGWEISITTSNPVCSTVPPPEITAGTVTGTITACEGTASADPNIQQFSVSGTYLTGDITVNAPTDFEVSASAGSGYGSSITLTPTAGSVSSIIYIRSTASALAGPISGNVTLVSAGATTVNVAVSGTVKPVPSAPTITPDGSTTFCSGNSVTLSSSSAAGNQWYKDGNLVSGETNQTLLVSSSGTYTVIVTTNGCSSLASAGAVVTVNPLPGTPDIPTAGGPTTFCLGGYVTLTTSGAATYQWYKNGSPISGATVASYIATASGEYTVVAISASGCASAPTAGITVTANPDVTPPVAPASLPDIHADCSATPAAPTATDNCAGTITGTTTTAFPVTTPGTTVITWTFNDGNGNTSSVTQSVIIVGPIPASIVCPANIIQNTEGSNCNKSIAVPDPVISINCGTITSLTWIMTGATTGSSAATGINNVGTKTFNTGITTISYTVKDASGNTASCSFTVTVTDNQPPVVTCPANITQTLSTNSCTKQIAVANPVISDNCGVTKLTWVMTGATTGSSASTGINYVGTKTFNAGVTTIVYTITDAAGNTGSCSFSVSVTENVLPTITCPSNKTVNNDWGYCYFSAVNLTVPQASDNCGIASLTNNAPAFLPPGATTVTWTVIDKSGNSRSCSQVITVVDAQNPEVTSPANISANTSGNCSASVATPNPTYFDNCGVTRLTWVMTGATTGSSPSTGINNVGTRTFNTGVTTITYTVRDAAGRTGSSYFSVIVTDNEKPSLICPSNISQTATNGVCSRSIAVPAPAYSDNCAVTKLTWFMTGATSTSSPLSGINLIGTRSFNVGVTTVTYSIWDAANNTRSCTFTVTVTDAQPPVVTCPSSRTLCKKANNSYSIPSLVASDNCGIASTVYAITGATTRSGTGLSASGIFNLGLSVITWTVTDFNGNVTTCTTNVNIVPSGNCDNVRVAEPSGEVTLAEKAGAIAIEKIEAIAYPNPSGSFFNLQVRTNRKETVEITMFDMLGKVVEVQKGAPGQTFRFGEHVVSGMYMLEVKQAGETALVKVLKK